MWSTGNGVDFNELDEQSLCHGAQPLNSIKFLKNVAEVFHIPDALGHINTMTVEVRQFNKI